MHGDGRMSHQPQDERVERATSRWGRTPVRTACLRVLAFVGIAGAAWFAANSTAYADSAPDSTQASASTVASDEAGSTGDNSLAPITALAADAVQPVTSTVGSATDPVVRPLAAAVQPTTSTVAGAASPNAENASGVLAPATTPASETSDVDGTAAVTATPARSSDSNQEQAAEGARQTPGSTATDAIFESVDSLFTPLGVNEVVSPVIRTVDPVLAPVVQTATSVLNPVTSVLEPVLQPANSVLSPVLSGLAPVTSGLASATSPVDREAPVVSVPNGDDSLAWTDFGPVMTDSASASTGSVLKSASRMDFADTTSTVASTVEPTTGPRAGSTPVDPVLPLPAPVTAPVFPATGSHNGSTASTFTFQHDGSTGAVSISSLQARLTALRAWSGDVEAGVTLVRAEELSVSPD